MTESLYFLLILTHELFNTGAIIYHISKINLLA